MRIRTTLLGGAVAGCFSVAAHADPATGSAYYTDPQQSYVFDQTSESIGTVNMITCIMAAMNANELVNQGNYVALVDQNKCDTNKRSSANNSGSSSGNAGADYMRGVVNATRPSILDPMRVKVWFENNEGGQSSDIWVNIRASEGPSASNPYGDFRLDFCGTNGTNCMFQGFLSGSSSGITFAEREGNQGSRQLFLTKGANDSGAGALRSVEAHGGGGPTTTEFQFAYNTAHFLRRAAGGDSCFDRRISQSRFSVWRYGVYDANGARVNRNSGFPISFSSGGQTYQGYAGYHGVFLPPPAASALTTGTQVTRQNFGSNEGGQTYTVVRALGRLTKYTRRSTTLAAFANVRFNFGPFHGLENATANAIKPGENSTTIRSFQLETYWDATDNKLKVAGYQNCSSSGCNTVTLPTPVALTNTDLGLGYTASGIFGWSQSYGGPVSIPALTVDSMTGVAPAGEVNYRTQDVVYPGAAGAPANLYCVANCPTGTEIANLVATTAVDPYANGSENRWAPTAAAPIAYTFNGTTGNLEQSGLPVTVASNVTQNQLQGIYSYGIRSGKLLANAADFDCDGAGGGTNNCAQKADSADVYYEWETGVNPWNQFIGLKSGDTYVTFDPPLGLRYTVPNGGRYGEFAGSTIMLQFAGFGDLHGIPGRCVSPVTNETVSCNSANARYVPAFSIPESLTDGVAFDSSNNRYYIRWLDREVRFNRVANASCNALVPDLGSLASLPSLTGLANPTDPNDPIYIGAKPTVTSAPRVIHGVTQ